MEAYNDKLWSFNFELFKYLRDASPDNNLFFSPLSVTVTLSMALLGSRGKTADEMLNALNVKKKNETNWHAFLGAVTAIQDKSPLTVANKMFVEKSFEVLKTYVELLLKHYGVEHGEVNFSGDSEGAVLTINEWVSDATKKKIPELLGDLDKSTRVVLVNAVHFKGFWENQFDKMNTEDKPFYVDSSKKVDVPMMYKSFEVPFYSQKLGLAVRLLFKEDGYSMLLMLPDKKSSLTDLENALIGNKSLIKEVLRGCRKQKVDVFIPRFTLRWTKELKSGLQHCGMKDLFDIAACDLSGVTGSRDLYVSAVVHEAVLEVNEEGAEAAAATAVVMLARSRMPMPKPQFLADRPFLVSILKGDSVVFFGRVTDPTAK